MEERLVEELAPLLGWTKSDIKMPEQITPLAVSASVAARLLGVSKPTIYQYIHREDFPSFKLGNRTLVSVEGLKKWIEAQTQKGMEVRQ